MRGWRRLPAPSRTASPLVSAPMLKTLPSPTRRLSIAAIVLSAIAIAAVVCSWIFGFFVRRGMRSLEESEKGNDRV